LQKIPADKYILRKLLHHQKHVAEIASL
jgi:hypothetical protein